MMKRWLETLRTTYDWVFGAGVIGVTRMRLGDWRRHRHLSEGLNHTIGLQLFGTRELQCRNRLLYDSTSSRLDDTTPGLTCPSQVA